MRNACYLAPYKDRINWLMAIVSLRLRFAFELTKYAYAYKAVAQEHFLLSHPDIQEEDNSAHNAKIHIIHLNRTVF